jgi:tRNA nucleotidyltransferase/poly(A) polymerase
MNPRSVTLGWSDFVLDLADQLADEPEPVYAVGGAVRDAFLRRPIKDLDLATPGSGLRLARRLADRLGGAFYALDSQRDVGRALVDTPDGRLIIDVARLRGDLESDLRDRDFTINASAVDLRLALDLVYDPLGGIDDLAAKVLRRCSATALDSDPIRVMRAVRQAAQFGLRIEPETLRDVRASAPQLSRVSAERVRDELFKLLALPKPGTVLRVADNVGILAQVLPDVLPLRGLEQHPPHVYDVWGHTLAVVESLSEILAVISPTRTDETAAQFTTGMIAVALDRYRMRLQEHIAVAWSDERTHRALLMLVALLHDVGKAHIPPPGEGGRRFAGHEAVSAELTERRAESLRLSNAEKDRLVALVRHHMLRLMWEEPATPVNLHRFWRKLGAAGVDAVLFTLADYLGTVGATVDQAVWLRLLERAQVVLGAYYDDYARIVSPPALITGSELMERLSLKAGRQVGELLDMIREAQVEGQVTSFDQALVLARQHLSSGSESSA